MKTLICKELRENLKVTVPAFILLTIFLTVAAWDGGETAFLSSEFLRIISLGCAGTAGILGWLQIHHERPRDLWAFLVHRPITRTEIFFSKMFAGLLMYFTAVGLPMLGYLIWVSVPGHVSAPFEWSMILPGIGCCLLGTLWYFAAMLTSLRDARWYASRGMALAAAFPLHAFALRAPGLLMFWQFQLFIVLLAAALALAVWGSFQSDGSYRKQPAPARAALAAVVSLGMTVIVVIAIAFLAAALHSADSYDYYAVTKSGAIFHVSIRGNQPSVITDLNGARLNDPKTGGGMELEEFNRQGARIYGVSANFTDPPPRTYNFEDPREFFYHPWRELDGIRWYWTRQGHLAGYEGRTHRVAGSLAPQDLTKGTGAVEEPFLRPSDSGNRLTPRTLATARTVYEVDLRNRAVKPILSVSPDDRIGGTRDVSENATAVITKQFIQLVDNEGKLQWQLPHDPEYRQPRLVDFFPLEATNQYVIWIYPQRLRSENLEGKIDRQMVRVSGSEVGPRIGLKPPHPPQPGDGRIDMMLSFCVPPEFPFLKPLLMRAMISHVPIQWRLVEIAAVSAALCAITGWLIGRRYRLSLRSQVGWALFHLLTGFPGFLAFLAVRDWPVREPCPSCRRLRTVDRERCEYCDGAFAPPERNGSEIFEVVGTV